MRRTAQAIVLFLGVLLALTIAPWAQAQQLPPGAKEEVLGESPSSIPGIEKIVMKRFTLDPGAKLVNFTLEHTDFCVGYQGEATVTVGDKKIVRKAGHAWVAPKGVTFTMENAGTVPFVDIFFELIEKK